MAKLLKVEVGRVHFQTNIMQYSSIFFVHFSVYSIEFILITQIFFIIVIFTWIFISVIINGICNDDDWLWLERSSKEALNYTLIFIHQFPGIYQLGCVECG